MSDGASGISLGWLLAIALGGGTLLFTSIGLLLVWWVKRRNKLNARLIYGGHVGGRSGMTMPSSTRLAKRPLLLGSFSSDGRSSTSGLSDGMSLPSGLLPPLLPVFNSSTSSWLAVEGHQSQSQPQQAPKMKKKSMSWTLDEDDLHGPKINKNARDSWFERDSWSGFVPTLPDLGDEEKRMEEVRRQQQEQQQQNVMLQRELQQGYEPQSKAAESGARSVRRPEQTHRRRASMVDINLKAILQSTELRLQHQRSRSHSVVENSSKPMEDPKLKSRSSQPTMPSQRSAHAWPSTPNKANQASALPKVAGTPHTLDNTNANATSDLIAVATESLELPGGTSSPSKARANHWEQQFRNSTPVRPPKNPQQTSPQRVTLQQPYPRLLPHLPTTSASPRGSASPSSPASRSASPSSPQIPHSPRISFPPFKDSESFELLHQDEIEGRRSIDSDDSSTLSTLYSVNEPEEKISTHEGIDDDPFTGGYSGQRPLTFTSALLSQKAMMSDPMLLQPPRPFTIATHEGMQGAETFQSGGPIVIEPLFSTAHMGNVQRHSQIMEPDAMSEVEPSEASFESVSVHDSDSDATVEAVIRDTPDSEWVQMTKSRLGRKRPASSGASSIESIESQHSSSPYDEREVMTLLMTAAVTPKLLRSLPPPMSMASPDGTVVSLGLAPRPRSVAYSGMTRQVSNSSSLYTTDTATAAEKSSPEIGSISTGSPQARRSAAATPSVDDTVAELRRMNSLVSSYSAASLTSTVVTDADSGPPQGAPTSGSKAIVKPVSMIVRPSTETTSTAVAANRYQQYTNIHKPGKNSKQSAAPGVLRVNNNKNNNSVQPASPGLKNNLKGPKLSPTRVSEQQRPKGESPGLYDKDGFLKEYLTEEQDKVEKSPSAGKGKKPGAHSAK